jgi:tRNA pseudouridine55 synthase
VRASPNGIVLVDKPQGPSSHTVVAIARRLLGTRKIGHAGTLDPMATGLLVLGVGASTRLLTYLVGADKTYTATIRLGAATVTDDAEGDVVATASVDAIRAVTDEAIGSGITALTGSILQRPSAVSAIKVDGKRAYDRVRAGEDVLLDARSVTVSRFAVLDTRRDEAGISLDVVVDCSSGTYIRALARDLGEALGVGGHLTALRRTRVGEFDIADACEPDDISAERLIAPATVARGLMPVWETNDSDATDIGHGKKVATEVADAPLVAAIHDDRLIAIVGVSKGTARVVTGFPND